MADKAEGTATLEQESTTTPETVETTQPTAEKQEPTKTFTQADVDRLIGERLAREKAKMPADDDLKAYKEWKKAQQSEVEKAAEREKEYQATVSRAAELERELAIVRAGVKPDDAEFVIYKVGKMEGNFSENLTTFLAENKKYTEPDKPQPKVIAGGQKASNEIQDAVITAAREGAGLH